MSEEKKMTKEYIDKLNEVSDDLDAAYKKLNEVYEMCEEVYKKEYQEMVGGLSMYDWMEQYGKDESKESEDNYYWSNMAGHLKDAIDAIDEAKRRLDVAKK